MSLRHVRRLDALQQREAVDLVSIGAADDVLERRAERLADVVVDKRSSTFDRSAAVSANASRITAFEPGSRASGPGDTIRRHAVEPTVAATGLSRPSLVAASTAGRPLAGDIRRSMERSFGHDLSAVRIHRGVASARLADEVGADAFTVGSDIHFGRHRYAPGTRSGDRLLAHELVHVVAGDADCVRRRIAFDTKRLNTARTAGGRIRAHWKGDEITTIKAMVRDYQAVNDATKRRSFAQLIEAATASWLADHGDEPGKQVQRLKSAVEDLHAETQVELSRLEAEDRFLADAQGGDLRQLTHKAKSAIGVAQEYAAGTATADRRREMDDLLRRYGISQAEFLAMRAFSSGGFKYMNPATANDRERMTRAFPLARQHPRRQQELMEEGSLSSAVAIEGLRKMPPTRGVVMRGERMSQAEFETRFTVGRRVPILSLTSTTYMDRVARDFAAGNATAFRADQTVSVVVRYDARDARDLRPAAYHDDSEGEFVLLPGAEFVVKSVELDAIRSSGRTMHVVTLKQVKRAT